MAFFQIYGAVGLALISIVFIQLYSYTAFNRSFFYLPASAKELETSFIGENCSTYVLLPQQEKLAKTNLTAQKEQNQYANYDMAAQCFLQNIKTCSPAYIRVITDDRNKIEIISTEKVLGKCTAKVIESSGWNDTTFKKTLCISVTKVTAGLKVSNCTDFSSYEYP